MWLPKARLGSLAEDMVRALVANHDIETSEPAAVRADLEAVLSQFSEDRRSLSRDARELAGQRGLNESEAASLRKRMAGERGIKNEDEALDDVLDQLAEMLMHSTAVEEVFAPDHVLRLRLREPLRRQLGERDAIEDEVRGQLKHVAEGSAVWEVEYARLKEQVLRRKGL